MPKAVVPARKRPSEFFQLLEDRRLLAATTVQFTDADGTVAKATLSGNGAIVVNPVAGGFSLTLTGTDQGSTLRITGKGGTGRVNLVDVNISGAMRSIAARTTDLAGNVTLGGNVASLVLGSFLAGNQHTLSIGGSPTAGASAITLGQVVDLTLNSGSPIKSLTVSDWDDSGSDDLIIAPFVKSINAKGDLAAGGRIENDGANGDLIEKLQVRGVLAGTWYVANGTGVLKAGSVGAGFSMNVAGKVDGLNIGGNVAGVIAATEFGKITIRGGLNGARILAGADLGADARLGGVGDNLDLFFRGIMDAVTISGVVTDSVVAAGLDPVDGVFGNADDFITGKQRSAFAGLTIRGTANDASTFGAGVFGKRVSVGGTRVDPAGDPRFLLASTAPDTEPPVIAATLKNDTGTPGDSITNDPTIIGRVTDLGRVTRLRYTIDFDVNSDEAPEYSNILSLLEANGTFELSGAAIEQFNGGPLAPGVHTISFVAEDDSTPAKNISSFFTVTFTYQP